MFKIFKKLGRQNNIMKPLSTLITSAAPIGYLLNQTSKLIKEPINEELVIVSSSLVNGFQGGLILLVIMLSIIQTYKPSKAVVISLVVGGIMILAGSLFMTIGITLALYGLGNIVNNVTVNKLVIRNNKLIEAKENKEVERLLDI